MLFDIILFIVAILKILLEISSFFLFIYALKSVVFKILFGSIKRVSCGVTIDSSIFASTGYDVKIK